MVELVPTLLRQELARLAEDDQRLDGRSQWEGRATLSASITVMPRVSKWSVTADFPLPIPPVIPTTNTSDTPRYPAEKGVGVK